jgi:MtrB/PioB family decaheme-associated outer membrane protein
MPTAGDVGPGGDASRAAIQGLINAAAGQLELGTRRDRATVAYRATPTPDADFSVEYNNERRTGVVPGSIPYFWDVASPAATHYPIGLPVPVDDRTQDVEAKGEYQGFIGSVRWTSSVAYNGSFYQNSLKQLDAQNPFCAPGFCDVINGPFFAPSMLRLGLDPSNNANAITWNSAVDVPFWKTRYVSTVQYNNMRQNDPFIDTGTNGLIAPPVTTLTGVPVGSLNGEVQTILWNNVLTTRPTNEVKLTFRGRHYESDNKTPMLSVADWIANDTQCASGAPNPDGTCPGLARNTLPSSYTKDNASAEARWDPARWIGFGGGYYFARWDRTFASANVTNESTGKVYVDLKPVDLVHARASYSYGERRYEIYDTGLFVLTPGLFTDQFATNLRRFDMANRNRQKADVQVDFAPANFLSVTPNFGVRWDDYPDTVANPLGLRSNHSWNAGVEIGVMINPRIKVLAGYNYEDTRLLIASGNGAAPGCPPDLTNMFNDPTCTWSSNTQQRYHTFLAAADVKVIPDKFDLRFEAIYTVGTDESQLTPCIAGTGCNGLTGLDPAFENFGQFPPGQATFQRYNVIGKYYVDPSFVRQMGWAGDVVIKGRYTYVRNSVSNFALDNMTPYIATPDSLLEGGGRSLFLAANDPNYSAHVLALSVALKW